MNHVAEHYGSAIALCDGRPGRGRGEGGALARVGPAADRARRLGHLRDPDVRHPPRAGAAGRAGAGGEDPRRRRPIATGPGVRGWSPCWPSWGWSAEARRELAMLAAEGIDGFRASLWLATLAYLTDACAALGDETMAAIVYPELEPLAGANVMIGHLVACYGAADRYLGMLAATLGEADAGRAALRAGDGAEPADGRVDLGRPHRLRVRPLPARPGTRVPRAGRGAARRGGRPGRADRDGRAAGQGPLARRAPPPTPACPTGSPRARRRSSRWSPGGSATARSASELSISEHTAANHIRSILRKTDCANRTEAASYAHRHGLASD